MVICGCGKPMGDRLNHQMLFGHRPTPYFPEAVEHLPVTLSERCGQGSHKDCKGRTRKPEGFTACSCGCHKAVS